MTNHHKFTESEYGKEFASLAGMGTPKEKLATILIIIGSP